MPSERDRIIGDLAVEQGLLTPADRARYDLALDAAPQGPSLAQRLLRDGRATQQDLERLRSVWQERQRAGPAPVHQTPPPRPRPLTAGPFPVAEPPPVAAPEPVAAPPPTAAPADDPMRDAFKKDEVLARVLLAQGATTVERLRECRALQLQHRARLGAILAKKGYVAPAAIENAVRFIRETVVFCASCGEGHDARRLAPGAGCPKCGAPLGASPPPQPAPAPQPAPFPAPAPFATPAPFRASRPFVPAPTSFETDAPTIADDRSEMPTLREQIDRNLFPSAAPGAPPESRVGVRAPWAPPAASPPATAGFGMAELSSDELAVFGGPPKKEPPPFAGSIDELDPGVLSAARSGVAPPQPMTPPSARDDTEDPTTPDFVPPAERPAADLEQPVVTGRRMTLPAPQRPQKKPAPVGKIIGIAAGALVLVALLAVGGIVFVRSRRISENLGAGDKAYAAKDWRKARGFYKNVLADDPAHAVAKPRLQECDKEIAAIELREKVKAKLAEAAAAPSAAESLKLLAEVEPQAPWPEVYLAIARAHRRRADDLRRDRASEDERRELDDGAVALEKAAKDRAKDAELVLERARLNERAGRAGEAFDALVELSESDKDGARGSYARGRIALRSNHPDEALRAFDEAIGRAEKDVPEVRLFRAMALVASKDPARALEDLDAAIAADASDPRPLVERAAARIASDPSRARDDVAKALDLAPRYAPALALKGEILANEKQPEDALRAVNDALEQDPSLPRARRVRGLLRAARNDAGALDDVDFAIKHGFQDDVALRKLRAEILCATNRAPQAVEDLNEVIRVKPEDVGARLLRAQIRIRAKEPDGAMIDLKDVINRQPNLWPAHLYMGVCLWQKGDLAGGQASLRHASELAPTENEKVQPLVQLALLLSDSQKHEDALKVVDEIEQRFPGIVRGQGYQVMKKHITDAAGKSAPPKTPPKPGGSTPPPPPPPKSP